MCDPVMWIGKVYHHPDCDREIVFWWWSPIAANLGTSKTSRGRFELAG